MGCTVSRCEMWLERLGVATRPVQGGEDEDEEVTARGSKDEDEGEGIAT